MAALVISMGVLAYGYDSAFIGTTITHPSFKKDFGITPANKNEISSNITSICEFGVCKPLCKEMIKIPFS